MTPSTLAAEIGISPKTLRAYLRRTFPRELMTHGTAWMLTAKQIAAARQNFSSRPRIRATLLARKAGSAKASRSTRRTSSVDNSPLRCYVRPELDVLFAALNPPAQSASNGHWFSGSQSAFFKLLYRSGLITADLPKATADELVFGTTQFNHKGASYGVTDLRPDVVEVNSGRVALRAADVEALIGCVRENKPRLVCIIHSRVRDAFNSCLGRIADVIDVVAVGKFTHPLADCSSRFICNYFPNGNSISDQVKLDIFRRVRAAI
jgi:hypothetical protein